MRIWTKNANCWEILRKFWKFLMKILLKNGIFILFLILFFENLLLKIEPSEITPVFYNNFFGFGGGGFPPSPWLLPWSKGLSPNGVYMKMLRDSEMLPSPSQNSHGAAVNLFIIGQFRKILRLLLLITPPRYFPE